MRIGSLLLEPGRRTYIMGVLNVTPDSFSGDGLTDAAGAAARAHQLVEDGADIIDLGGESTRPGAQPVPLEEELGRVIPVVERLATDLPAPISVDTTKAEVARQALRAGAAMINDVSALRADPGMAAVVAAARVPVVLMHGYGMREERAGHPDVVQEVLAFLSTRVQAAVATGIAPERIVVDPGFGFGKSFEENLEILRRLRELGTLGRPVLIGTSRKGTVGQLLGGLPPARRDEGTAATVAISIMQGADIVRVHNVRMMAAVARVTDALVRQTAY